MSADADGFLARWSRRKLDLQEEIAPSTTPAVPTAERVPAQPAVTETEAAPPPDLPELDSITAETDISGFLAKSVPAGLRNAALRRMWSADPAIRDFVGPARDYGYDWNVPGGVPGFGPIEPTYDVAGTLDRMFSRAIPEEPESPQPEARHPATSVASEGGTSRAEEPVEAAMAVTAEPAPAQLPPLSAESREAETDHLAPRPHGSATPV